MALVKSADYSYIFCGYAKTMPSKVGIEFVLTPYKKPEGIN
jgi:hypothetical protein